MALIAVIFGTRSERVVLSTALSGRALRAYFGECSLGIFPRNRLCRGVLILPEDHNEYRRGRHRQALRTNLRRAQAAGIQCLSINNPQHAFDEITEIVTHRRGALIGDELPILESWRTMLSRPEMTLIVARDRRGLPLAFIGAVIDDDVCLMRVAVASSHDARWALHDHLVRILISRGVSYLLAEGGGPFGALGFHTNVRQYQRLLGYELRHLSPRSSPRRSSGESARPFSDITVVSGSRQPSHAVHQVGMEKAT